MKVQRLTDIKLNNIKTRVPNLLLKYNILLQYNL